MYRLPKIQANFCLKKIVKSQGLTMVEKKERLQRLHKHLYNSCNYGSEGYIEEMSLFGQNAYIVSSATSSLYSLTQALSFLDYVNVECVVLDKYSQKSLDNLINLKTPSLSQLDDKALLGKTKFTRFFVDFMPKSLDYFMAEHKKYIYRVNDKNETAYFEDQLSVAYNACNDIKKNIILSKPESQIFIEDLVMQISLDEMKEIFHKGIKCIREKYPLNILYKRIGEDKDTPISDETNDLLVMLQEYVKSYHHKEIFSKWSLYNASLVHKCARTFKNTANFTDRYFTRQTVEYCQQSVLPEYNQVFRSFLSKQIQEIKYRSVLDPELENQKYQATLRKDKAIILEQYALASFLVNSDLRNQAIRGDDIFFGSIYKQKISSSDIPQYLSLHQEYSKELHNLQNDIIKSIEDNNATRIYVNTYRQQVEAIQLKKSEHKYEYQIHDLSNSKQQLAMAIAFHTQINNIITKRINAGISQTESIVAMKQIRQENYTEQNLRSYIQILMDANISLGHPLKFPKKLQDQLLPYVSNVERERIATQNAYDTSIPTILSNMEFIAADAMKGKQTPPLRDLQDPNFSDDESAPQKDKERQKLIKELGRNKDSLQYQNFILGTKDSTKDFPYDISSLTYEEMMDLGFETVGHQDFKIASDGQIESNGKLNEEVLKEMKSFLNNEDSSEDL